jgi:hypothetical protein
VRHVRVSEAACPFCGATLTEAFRTAAPIVVPAGRRSRAALYALGTSTLALAAACSAADVPAPAYGAPTPSDASSDAQAQPLYGGPRVPVDAAPDVPLVDAAYGGPPVDAGSDAPDSD